MKIRIFIFAILCIMTANLYAPELDRIPYHPVSFEIVPADNGVAVVTEHSIYLFKELPSGFLVSERRVNGKFEIMIRPFKRIINR